LLELTGEGRELIEQRRGVAERAVLDLQLRQTIVDVADALVQNRDGVAVVVGNRESRGVIARVVDAVTTGESAEGCA